MADKEIKYVTLTLQHPDMGEKPYKVTLPEDQTIPQEVAYHYLPHLNPDGASFPGVPLGDLTVAQVEAQPKHVQKALKIAPFYLPHEEWADYIKPKPEPKPETKTEGGPK